MAVSHIPPSSPSLPPQQLGSSSTSYDLRSRSQPRRQPSSCPLDSLSLQPVGTSDHYLERCYCYLCTCGSHLCPAEIRKAAGSPHVKASQSNYRQEFTKKEMKPQQSFKVPILNSHSSGKMDLRTTSHTDFKPPGPSHVHMHTQDIPLGSLKFVTRSSYQRDFPNWKPGETVLFRSKDPPYRGNIVEFKHKSTYREDYELANRQVEHFHYAQPRQDPITVLTDFYGETSNRLQYQAPSLDASPQRSFQPAYHLAPQGFKLTTTYRQEFPVKDQSPRVPFKQAARNAIMR